MTSKNLNLINKIKQMTSQNYFFFIIVFRFQSNSTMNWIITFE